MMLFDTKGKTPKGPGASEVVQTARAPVSQWLLMLIAVCGLLAVGSYSARAQVTCITVSSGDWEVGSTWDDDRNGDGIADGTQSSTGITDVDNDTGSPCDEASSGYPSASGEDAVINTGGAVTVDVDNGTDLIVGSITIENGTRLRPEEKFSVVSRDMIADAVTVTSGFLNLENSDSDLNLTVNGVFDNDDEFNIEAGSATLNGFSDNTGSVNVASGGTLDVNNTFENLAGGTLDIGNGTLTLTGGLRSDGAFSSGVFGTVIFDGDNDTDGPQSLKGSFAGSNNFQNLVVGGNARLDPDDNLNNANSIPVTVEGDLTVQSGGQYGSGSGEGSDILYKGFDFAIAGTGSFFSNELSFNTPSSNPGNVVSASGEVFSLVRITGGSFVELSSQFIINGLLVIDSSDELFLATGGSLRLNDDFEINGTYSPNQRATIFSGQTNTGGGNPSLTTCSGVKTSDGDCEQDTRGSGAFDFGPVQINLDNTRVTLSTDNSNPNTPNVTDLTIDPDNDNTNVALILDNTNLDISGDLENNGTFNAGTRLVTFNGGTTQDIISSVPITFSRIAINNSGTSSVDVRINSNAQLVVNDTLRIEQGGLGFAGGATNASLEIRNELNLRGGLLDATGGPITMVSEGATESYIRYNDTDGLGGVDGDIVGDIIKQRELQGPQNWYYISGPAGNSANDTFDEFFRQGTGTNSLWLQGFTGANVEPSNPSVSNLRIMDETQPGDDDNGWVSVTDAFNQMESGRGYILFAFGDDNFDGSVSGSEDFEKLIDSDVEPILDQSFDYSSLITVTDNGGTGQSGNATVDENEGWQMLGNPYLATLSFSDMTRTNIDDVVYTYDPVNSRYISYSVGGGTGDLDEGFLAPQQGFLVKATDGTSTGATFDLDIDDITTVQVDTSDFFQKSTLQPPPAVTFQAEINDTVERTYVAFVRGSTMEKDPSDAYQLGAPISEDLGQFSLFTTLSDGTGIDINALPYGITEETAIPMAAVARGCNGGIPFSGTVTLTWPEIRSMPDTVGLAIRDTQTGDLVDIRAEDSYEFSVTSNDDCTTQNLQQASGGQAMTAMPTPSVMKVPQSKSTGPDTRFEFIVTPNSALPVEFGRFAGSADGENAALLEWSTLSETNNAGFYVEQKVNGRFQTVSPFVASKAESGTSSESLSYRYRVADLDLGTTHTFRLRQVDVDGSPTLSEPVDVTLGIAGEYRLEAYPNPVQSGQQATVGFAVKERQPVSIELYNTLGQRVRTIYDDTPQVVDELETVTLDIGDLASGLYFVRMRGESFTTTQKLVVVR